MTRHRIRLSTAAALSCAALLLSACGSDDPDSSGSGGDTTGGQTTTESTSGETTGGDDGATAEATITIKDFAYGDPLTVAPGTEVTVVNEDDAPHNANDADGAFSEALLQQGESATFIAPDAEGTYNLICTEHPQMAGELIVEAS